MTCAPTSRVPGRPTPCLRVVGLAGVLTAGVWVMSCARRAPRDTGAPAPPVTVRPTVPPGGAAGPSADSTEDRLRVTEAEYQGWKYYHVYCDRCHGQDALGSSFAPNLRHSVSAQGGGVTIDSFTVVVRGGSSNREMPPFRELLGDEQIRHVYAYLSARSSGRLAAGRPHRAQ